ncbi:hypothetical protein GCM10022403_059760 [Streptomyces coacervatus]|uniref:Tat pathway signal sequence domain protein n=1 Tax=Streptomyces coacervatus TaxID=647381 RepID=A0ABP7IHA1_9ACTN|nr:hypothetical protein [Streptomyces coacervatus]MDF2269778.1 hypothetical protein [Streptomyces coacervatus]
MVSPPEGDGPNTEEIVGDERPLVRERWQALSRRTRVTVAATTCAVVLSGVLAYVVANRPPAPPPDPVAATTVRITDVGLPVGLSPEFPVTLSATADSRVVLMGMQGGYDNLLLWVMPAPGAALPPGRARILHTRFNVFCHGHVPRRGMPLLFVTVRNGRGEGLARVVPTEAQFDRLGQAVQKVCRK